MPLSTGMRLGPYEILSVLGAGGMGEVYRAKDTRLDRTVAIKILPEHLSSNPQRRERFEREAKAISSLSHPHICPLYDVQKLRYKLFLLPAEITRPQNRPTLRLMESPLVQNLADDILARIDRLQPIRL